VTISAKATLDITKTQTSALTVPSYDATNVVVTTLTSTRTDPLTVGLPTGPGPVLQARALPATIPAYASACSSPDAYRSACSCMGVTSASAVTAPTPSTTVTVTARITSTVQHTTVTTPTVTQSLTTFTTSTTGTTVHTATTTQYFPACGVPSPVFRIRAVGGPLDGRFLRHNGILSFLQAQLVLDDEFSADNFFLNADGLLWGDFSGRKYAMQPGETPPDRPNIDNVLLDDAFGIENFYHSYVRCAVDPGTNVLSCRNAGKDPSRVVLQANEEIEPAALYLGTSQEPDFLPLTLVVVCL